MGDRERCRGGIRCSGGSTMSRSAIWFRAARRRLGVLVVAVLCLGMASVPAAQSASAGLLGLTTVRVIVTASSVASAQSLVLSVLGTVVSTLPIINGVVADILPVELPLLNLVGVTVTPDFPVAIGTGPPAVRA